MDDLQAIQNLNKGEIGRLEFLVVRYQAKAIRVAFLVTHNQSLAEDVVQDSFMRIYRTSTVLMCRASSSRIYCGAWSTPR